MIARIAAEVRREWAPWMGHKALQEVAEEIDEEYREEVVQEVLRQADIWRARQRPQQMEGRPFRDRLTALLRRWSRKAIRACGQTVPQGWWQAESQHVVTDRRGRYWVYRGLYSVGRWPRNVLHAPPGGYSLLASLLPPGGGFYAEGLSSGGWST